MKAGALIVPGAEVFSGEQGTGCVLGGKDTGHVYESTADGRQFSDQEINGSQERRHTIDKEHEDGSIADACPFAPAKGLQ